MGSELFVLSASYRCVGEAQEVIHLFEAGTVEQASRCAYDYNMGVQ